MSWMVIQLYSDVASHPSRGRRAARLSVARQQTVGYRGLRPRDQEKRTRRAPLRGCVLVDSSSSSGSSQFHCEIQNTKEAGWLYVAHSACILAAKLEVCPDAWVLRAVQRTGHKF